MPFPSPCKKKQTTTTIMPPWAFHSLLFVINKCSTVRWNHFATKVSYSGQFQPHYAQFCGDTNAWSMMKSSANLYSYWCGWELISIISFAVKFYLLWKRQHFPPVTVLLTSYKRKCNLWSNENRHWRTKYELTMLVYGSDINLSLPSSDKVHSPSLSKRNVQVM